MPIRNSKFEIRNSTKTTIAVIGPVYPYRAGIAYCTTRLSEELAKGNDVDIVSFSRQFPKRFYPGGDDVDATLEDRTPKNARFALDVVNPLTWIREGLRLRRQRPDAVVFVWWIWVWAIPYLVLIGFLRRETQVLLQCHNIGDKEPAWWKRWLTDRVLRRGDVLVVHAESELQEALVRAGGRRVVKGRLPVHELGGEIPPRAEAKAALGLAGRDMALFFGHVRPFKALDVVLRAWPMLQRDVVLVVAGEAWWEGENEYRRIAENEGLNFEFRISNFEKEAYGGGSIRNSKFEIRNSVLFDFRFIPDSEIATYFSAADVVLAPYRREAQSGVALTAFHFARPVIGTRVGGIPEIVRDGVNGYLIPVDDPGALAAAVDRFFGQADRPSFEQAAAAAARSNSWEDYGKLFSRLAERR